MNARLSHRDEWSTSVRDAMFDLLSAHFVAMSRDQFERDLENKQWAVLVEDEMSRLAGFSTFALYRTVFRDRPVNVVCSGDTIVDRAQPTSTALLRCWIDSVERLHEANAREPLYWLLIVSGFRTYRFLPVFWQTFFPRYDRATDPAMRELMDHLGAERFGRRYDRGAGIVRFEKPQVLRRDLSGIPAGRLDDPHVRFFAERNPGHERGDELVCLTRLCRSNLTRAGMRMARTQASLTLAGT